MTHLVRPGGLGQEEAHEGEGQASAPPYDVVPVLPRRAQVLQPLMQPLLRQLVQLCTRLPQQPASVSSQSLKGTDKHYDPFTALQSRFLTNRIPIHA